MRKWLILCMLPLACAIYTPKESVHWDVFVENQTPDAHVTFVLEKAPVFSETAKISPGQEAKFRNVKSGVWHYRAVASGRSIGSGTVNVDGDIIFSVTGTEPNYFLTWRKVEGAANQDTTY